MTIQTHYSNVIGGEGGEYDAWRRNLAHACACWRPTGQNSQYNVVKQSYAHSNESKPFDEREGLYHVQIPFADPLHRAHGRREQ